METDAAGRAGLGSGALPAAILEFQWLHTRKAGLQMDLAMAGRRLSNQLVEELDEFEFRRSGGMIYYFEESQRPLMESFVAERCAAGLPMELIDAQAARAHCPALSEKALGASFNPLDAHQDTRCLVELLARAAEMPARSCVWAYRSIVCSSTKIA